MFWIILIVIVLGGGVAWAIKEREILFALLALEVALLVFLIGVIVYCAIGQTCIPSDEVYETTETKICAISDNTGTFFVGRYHSDSSIFYSYLEETDDGGKTVGTISAYQATIYDNEKEQPYITKYKKHNSNPFIRFFFYTDTTEYKIYIPPESIRHDYSVDLK